MAEEPDYTLTIIQDEDSWVVCEGGQKISRPFKDIAEAGRWFNLHRGWHQPRCCVCGSAVTRPDDPWEAYSVDRYGPDWMHRSCMDKFHSWAEDEKPTGPGPHLIPGMDVLDTAWAKKNKQRP